MNKKTRAQKIAKLLDKLYPDPSIPLKHQDAYTLLIAVLLSAQCKDARVNEISPKLFKIANTPEKMSRLSPQEIEEIIRPCGLAPTKSKAIWNLSQVLIHRYEGKVPETFKKLEALPGVGHKTASVVLCQAFQKPAFPVDTHIHRLAQRWKLSSGKNVKKTEKDLKSLFSRDTWIKLHLQIIYYAREYCPARGHKIEQCPICHSISNS
ncbi:MAG: endonuclease III [Chlamydiae bacterium RIFCSPHIGHO2_12_FULL_44_59]|nr:MAG: endonuclease III [Chlamydiae bacterium RIFCSPHIGHO2_01_FULL_44_39]OGN59157.1 MAG: endonuclease III [Chlamydiae bacterium RIFCSPHIGHO2_02_FULL_45_9]OGN60467.1 MAG: endonuclease III [Chlamydiae bacterium RIFCSPHIGHO2_12_FULL_44_59]OGN66588.1 MAG: endonuclease III [Chlamydiae bacterium RIFCSPLOWO2_01_FULL_44_52]OGN69837.1 MAG: endonuclease III [Chlamydiae bacterium RIFCSPLOWO2_02_FULL_45_22]OGN70377.1 MAG: endonuclease III [Chlamydiae bacterium RIFCSPLOWO2_12_FULL_45_20]